MGNNLAQHVRQHIDNEFKRVSELNRTAKDKEKKYLVLKQVLQLEPLKTHPVDFTHLGTLYVLDNKKAGRFTLEEFYQFADLGRKLETKQQDFHTRFQAYCTLRMFCEVAKDGGKAKFCEWFCKLFAEYNPAGRHHKTKDFFNYDTVEALHKILNIQTAYGLSTQSFVNLMQSVGKEQKLIHKKDKKYSKDMVHVKVIHQFARNFIQGFVVVMEELGFNHLQTYE